MIGEVRRERKRKGMARKGKKREINKKR